MEHPLVSIVIPCYNAAGSVGDAVQSALEQTYSAVEVVLVDDGSTDGTLDVVRTFGRAVRILSGPNVGAAEARNQGAASANGALLQFLDADDRLYPTKLERQVPLARQYRPGMVFCDADVVDGVTNLPRGTWRTGSVDTVDPVVHALKVIVQTAGPLHWRESFERVGGFRAQTPPCDDRDLHLRLACAGVTFHHLPEPLYVMRRFEGSLSKRSRLRGLNVQRTIGEDALHALAAGSQLSVARRAAFAAFFAGTGRVALRMGVKDVGRECFQRALQIHPGGGISDVYSPLGQVMARLLGPATTERIASLGKAVRGHQEIA